jgi:hypothetical protein
VRSATTEPNFRAQGLALLVAVFALLTPAAHAAVPPDFFGVDDPSLGRYSPDLSALTSGGLQVVRAMTMTQINPAYVSDPGTYNWQSDEQLATSAATARLRWYPFIAYGPDGPGVTDAMAPPLHLQDYADYAGWFAHRFGRGGSFWAERPELPQLPVTTYEIWNEENAVPFWHPQDDAPERYADLYMAARDAIRAIDPSATVVVGGLALGQLGEATDEIEFLKRMFAHRPDLRGNVDAVGLHPYQSTVADVLARIAKFREALDQLAGPQVPIEVTEVGWSSLSGPENQRAANLGTLATELPRSDCNVSRLIPFTWITFSGGNTGLDTSFALANSNGIPNVAGAAYLDAVRTMRGLSSTPAPSGAVKICHPDPQARPVGPRLRLAIRRDGRRPRLRVSARCTAGCTLRTEVLAARSGSRHLKRLAIKRFGLSRRPRRFSLRIPHGVRRIELRVLATGRTGGHTSRTRVIRLRAARHR